MKRKSQPKPRTPAARNGRLPAGLRASVERVVPFEWTIQAYDARLPAVLSTPAMIGMMEVAAAQAIQHHLPEGTISVGTRIEVDHLKAALQGTKVAASARFAGYRGRFLAFDVEARAGETLIGSGRVFRAIVEVQGFHAQASARA